MAQELTADDDAPATPAAAAETVLEEKFNLNQARLGCVLAALKACGAKRVLDLGCGEGHLLRELMKEQAVRADHRHGRVDPLAGVRR